MGRAGGGAGFFLEALRLVELSQAAIGGGWGFSSCGCIAAGSLRSIIAHLLLLRVGGEIFADWQRRGLCVGRWQEAAQGLNLFGILRGSFQAVFNVQARQRFSV